jgi:hypothetical protein
MKETFDFEEFLDELKKKKKREKKNRDKKTSNLILDIKVNNLTPKSSLTLTI